MKETTSQDSKEGAIQNWKTKIKSKVDRVSSLFNALPLRTKQVIVIFFGMALAMICIVLVVQAFQGDMASTI